MTEGQQTVGSRQWAVDTGQWTAPPGDALPASHCPLPTAHCLLPTACCLLSAACCLLVTLAANAGDMKAEEIADSRLFHNHFGQTPMPNKSIEILADGVHFDLKADAKTAEYHSLYSFFKLGGDFEISADFHWKAVAIPKKGYGVSCGIQIETNDKKKSVALARGNFPEDISAYRVSTGTVGPDKKIDYQVEDPFPTSALAGRLILARKKKEIICSVADDNLDEPRELCRVPFTDKAVQRILIFADPGGEPNQLEVWITNVKIRADEMSHHMVKREQDSIWWGPAAGGLLIVVGTAGFLIHRRLRTGSWRGQA